MSASYELLRIIREELDDCDRALRNGDMGRARRELSDAMTKLNHLARRVRQMEIDVEKR